MWTDLVCHIGGLFECQYCVTGVGDMDWVCVEVWTVR
jgi:hypothetical protein